MSIVSREDRWMSTCYRYATYIGGKYYLGSAQLIDRTWCADVFGSTGATINLGAFDSSPAARAAVDAKLAQIRAEAGR